MSKRFIESRSVNKRFVGGRQAIAPEFMIPSLADDQAKGDFFAPCR